MLFIVFAQSFLRNIGLHFLFGKFHDLRYFQLAFDRSVLLESLLNLGSKFHVRLQYYSLDVQNCYVLWSLKSCIKCDEEPLDLLDHFV